MAIFEITIPPFYGKFEGGVFYDHNEKFCWRRRPSIANRNSPYQKIIRRLWTYCIYRWRYLSSADQASWSNSGGCYTPNLTGFETYMRWNVQRLYSGHPSLSFLTVPLPGCPFAATPADYYSEYKPIADQVLVTWSAGLPGWEYTQVFMARQVGFNVDDSKIHYLLTTSAACVSSYLFDSSAYSFGQIFRFACRQFNGYDLFKPWKITEVTKT